MNRAYSNLRISSGVSNLVLFCKSAAGGLTEGVGHFVMGTNLSVCLTARVSYNTCREYQSAFLMVSTVDLATLRTRSGSTATWIDQRLNVRDGALEVKPLVPES